jgi:hypothetical protein
MYVSRVLMVAAALSFAVASAAVAQSARAQGPKARPAQAQGPKTTRPAQAQGPKSDQPAQAQGPKGSRESRTIAANIARNPQLDARLKAMLPSGMTMEQAAEGFRNQGQFIAALEASKNQSIAFADLKAKMTGDNAVSLGQAIQDLRPEQTSTTTTPTTTPTTTAAN